MSSYLLFYPDDETMLSNKEYYSKLPKARDDFFTPRPVSAYQNIDINLAVLLIIFLLQEAVEYVKRLHYETKLLKFILTEFQFSQAINPEAPMQVFNLNTIILCIDIYCYNLSYLY